MGLFLRQVGHLRQVGQGGIGCTVVGLQLTDFRQQPHLEDHRIGQAGLGSEPEFTVTGRRIRIDGDFNQHRFGKLPVGLLLSPGEEENIRNMRQLSKAFIIQVVQQWMVRQFHFFGPFDFAQGRLGGVFGLPP
ncbi:hypothetical protein ES703_49985 [subsurface metagenome]